ncbi:alpha/beta hydrolase [Microbispora cellulosiformans]|uniref:Alpha/beta hydrolase n=1 Tax=Microbispora cellulosiformans TaxID=2614688 RepID=A0A5J5K0B5_9ACTN|nr:alpha/beta hydrolase [Microbispora cellulosiformans]KAA9377646.1 alpha/beta hydrolase [Microbispora cellulosiformans]
MHVVFVHGACVRDGAWWWHRTAAILEPEGVPSSAPPLPSCGEGGHEDGGRLPGTDGPSLPDDVAAVRAHLASVAGPVVVVAHSYGGVVVAEAVAGLPSVRHLLFVTSFLPEPGESLSSFGDGGPAPYLDFGPDGTFGVRPETATETFLQDCDEEAVAGAHARLVRQTAAVTVRPVSAAAWKEIPSTYLVCARDNGTPPSLQRAQAARADRVVEIDAGHHPFLSRPDEVAGLVLRLVAAG